MRLLRLALLGLWWRRATSLSLLVVATFTTAVAAAGPLYASAAGDAILQRTLRAAPVDSTGTGIRFTAEQIGKPSPDALERSVSEAFTGRSRAAYPTTVMQLSVPHRDTSTGAEDATTLMVTGREGFCREVLVVAGRCLDDAERTGFVVDSATARVRHLRIGQTVTLSGTRTTPVGQDTVLRLRGIVDRREPAAAYWFGGSEAVSPTDPVVVWVPRSYFDAVTAESGDNLVVTADLALDADAVHVGGVGTFEAAVDTATTRVRTTGSGQPSVATDVRDVVQGGLSGRSRLALPVAVVVLQLLALGWYLLHTLVSSAAQARGAEIALGKVRGLTSRATVLLTVLQPVVVLVAAVPIGVLGALLAVRALAPSVIGGDAQIRLGALAWAGAATAAVGGLVAASVGSVTVLRRPVLEQWRRTPARAGHAAATFEVAVVVLAVVGIVQLRSSGSLDSGSGSGLAVMAPALLMVAGAVVASRALGGLARLAFAATRGSGAVGTFIAVRQVARRPSGRRTFGVLTVAVALASFGTSSVVVLAHNRDDRARVDVGAAAIAHIAPDTRTASRVADVDGGRHQLTAVFEGSANVSTSSGVFDAAATATRSPAMLVVDPSTFGSVAYWRTDFGAGPLTRLLGPLAAPAPAAPVIVGDRMDVDVAATTVPEPLLLAADLTDGLGNPVTVRLGRLTEGDRTYRAALSACADGCRLRRVYVTRRAEDVGPFVTSFTLRAIRVLGSAEPSPVPDLSAVSWSPLNPTPDLQADPAETVTIGRRGVQVTVAVSGRPGDDVSGFGAQAGAVTEQPALVASGAVAGTVDQPVSVTSAGGARFAVRPAGRLSLLPRAGDAGLLLSRAWAEAASPSGYAALSPNQVWIAAAAPADTLERLRRAGVVVTAVERADDRATELSQQGPAFASALFVAGGFVAVMLAGAAAVLTLALLARRRIFELAALRALGVATRQLIASVVIEQAALVVFATLSGVALGAAAVALALPALPAYVDQPAYPAFLVAQPVGELLGVGGGICLLLVAAVTVSAAVLVRAASPSRLREAEA